MEFLVPITADTWITVLTKEYADPLLGKLVSKGYAVSSLHPDNCLFISRKNSVSSIIGLHLSYTGRDLKSTDVLHDLQQCLGDIKAYYYSIMVISGGQVSWAIGNAVIDINNDSPPSKKKDRSHLRIVKNEPPNNTT